MQGGFLESLPFITKTKDFAFAPSSKIVSIAKVTHFWTGF